MQELGRFLEFHARESRIRIHVLVLPKDGQIPALAQLERVAGGGLLKSDSCLLVYPVSEPWRARLFVSKAVHDRTSADFLAETARATMPDDQGAEHRKQDGVEQAREERHQIES